MLKLLCLLVLFVSLNTLAGTKLTPMGRADVIKYFPYNKETIQKREAEVNAFPEGKEKDKYEASLNTIRGLIYVVNCEQSYFLSAASAMSDPTAAMSSCEKYPYEPKDTEWYKTVSGKMDAKELLAHKVIILTYYARLLNNAKKNKEAISTLEEAGKILTEKLGMSYTDDTLEIIVAAHELRYVALGEISKSNPKNKALNDQYKKLAGFINPLTEKWKLYAEEEKAKLKAWVEKEREKDKQREKEAAQKELAEIREYNEKNKNQKANRVGGFEFTDSSSGQSEGTGDCWCEKEVATQSMNYSGSGIVASERGRTVFQKVKVRCPCK